MSLAEQAQTINTGIDSVKENLRVALQNKNVTVPTSAKLKDYPSYVAQVQLGIDTSNATAVSADIRSGKTAYVQGSLVTGTMQSVSLYQDGYLTVAINNGYSAGGQLTLTDSNLIADNIKKDVTIFGVTGTYEGAGGAGKVYVYTITGQSPESTAPVINGNYYEVTGDDIPKGIQALGTPLNYPVYTNGFGSFLFVHDSYGTGNAYNIGFAFGEQSQQVTYLYIKGSDGLNPIGGSSDYWMLSGIGWSGTVSAYQNNSGGGSSSADYIVSGATSYLDVNGEYVEDGTANGKPKYVNTVNSNAYIQCDNILGWAVFYYSQPRYYTNDTSSPTPPVSATWKQGNEIITVTKG